MQPSTAHCEGRAVSGSTPTAKKSLRMSSCACAYSWASEYLLEVINPEYKVTVFQWMVQNWRDKDSWRPRDSVYGVTIRVRDKHVSVLTCDRQRLRWRRGVRGDQVFDLVEVGMVRLAVDCDATTGIKLEIWFCDLQWSVQSVSVFVCVFSWVEESGLIDFSSLSEAGIDSSRESNWIECWRYRRVDIKGIMSIAFLVSTLGISGV